VTDVNACPAEMIDVLVLAYNRPASLSAVLDTLPTHLVGQVWIWIDGPRERPGDLERVQATRQVALEFLSRADGELKANSRNMGCRRSVTSGINWFLQGRTHGVILEDDVLSSEAFLRFSSESLASGTVGGQRLLGSVTGLSLTPGAELSIDQPYRLSQFFSSWGWGTWADRWFDMNQELLPWSFYEVALRQAHGFRRSARTQLRRIHGMISEGALDSWAYVTLLEHIRLGFHVLVPQHNMISNIGFDEQASHTVAQPSWMSAIPTRDSALVQWLVDNPVAATTPCWDPKADRYMARSVYGFRPRWGPTRMAGAIRGLRSKTR
jgi:hypothetical protein